MFTAFEHEWMFWFAAGNAWCFFALFRPMMKLKNECIESLDARLKEKCR